MIQCDWQSTSPGRHAFRHALPEDSGAGAVWAELEGASADDWALAMAARAPETSRVVKRIVARVLERRRRPSRQGKHGEQAQRL